VTVTVAEENGGHRALIDETIPCCSPGHPDAGEAARHAWRLTRAIARKAERAACTPS
jgi:hypothetical protein